MAIKKTKGFTLIELLVVISIIGVLSTVVIASLSSARSKGQIAAGLTFSGHNYHAFGADAAVMWNFDEGGASPATDISSNNIPGVLTGTTKSNVITPSGKGFSALFTAINQYILAADFSSRPIDLSTNGFTVSLWVRPTVTSAHLIDTLGPSAGRPFGMFFTPEIQILCGGSWSASGYSMVSNVWQHIAVSFNAGSYSLYVNGKFIYKTASTCTPSSQLMGYLNVGAQSNSAPTPSAFIGNIDEVAVYKSYLVASEIRQIYAEGLPTHTLAENR